jgi:hypothetical protein
MKFNETLVHPVEYESALLFHKNQQRILQTEPLGKDERYQ